MHVAIDTTPLESEHRLRGVGVYTKYLIDALQKYENKHTYSFFTRTQKVHKNADLVHYPYFDPFFLTLPLLKPKPTVVTVHDLIPLVFPDKFPAGIRGRLRWEVQKASLRMARRVIADSNTSKEDVARITGYSKNNIDTVYLASTLGPFVVTKNNVQSIQKQFSLPPKYILCVGDVNWNKNIHGLLHAFSKVLVRHPYLKCIIVGKAFLDTRIMETREINRLVSELGLESHVVRSGYVSDRQLSAMYSLAACLIQPSYYEGFGLPVLDAMVCGCPVVASDVSSLSEISGPAIRVQPEDTQSIASGVEKVLAMPEGKRSELVSRQYAWAKRFRWEKVARQTVLTYERALR